MPKINESINLKSKFKLAEFDFNKDNDSSLDQVQIYRSDNKRDSVLRMLFAVIAQSTKLFKSAMFLISALVKNGLTLCVVYCNKVSFYFMQAKENQEINSHQFLKKSSILIDEARLRQNLEKSKNEQQKIELALMLTNAIGRSFCNTTLDYNENQNEDVRFSIEYQTELFTFITKKMTEARLSLNIKVVDIRLKPILKSNKVETTITFTLNRSGATWSNIFSSFITKKLLVELSLVGGSAIGVNQHNLTSNIETFSLLITHDLLSQKTHLFNEPDKLDERIYTRPHILSV
jgi:hypothetical protein